MSTSADLKERIAAVVESHRDDIVEVGETIMRNPELGFKEFETAALVQRKFDEFELDYRAGLARTGVKARIDTGRPGPTLALIGELDALTVAGHPQENPETHAAHACGHNAQIAGLMGAAAALSDPTILRDLCGSIVLFAVPAEEYVEVEYRHGLVQAGELEFLGGKPELIARGEFDDVDLAMMIHTHSRPDENGMAAVTASNNGCVVKQIRYLGKAAHAGGAPHLGINALYAAHIGLAAINAVRETFRDDDAIRVHPIITRGGDLVNVIPADVTLETYVRGKTTDAIDAAAVKVDRALKAGALALGAEVEIITLPGYLPLANERRPGRALHGESARRTWRRRRFGDRGTAPDRPTWATSPTSCRRCTHRWPAPWAATTPWTGPSPTRRWPTWNQPRPWPGWPPTCWATAPKRRGASWTTSSRA